MTPWVKRLLIANVVMFFLQQSMPGLTPELMLLPAALLQRPWTMVTYMFLHSGLRHIFSNMIALYFFGPRVEERLGSPRFFVLYMLSGISGALASFMTPNAYILGASGAVLGVALAFAKFWPREKVYIWGILPVEARWLVVGFTLYSIVSLRGDGGGVAHYAHLGGFVGAFLYLQFLARRAPSVQWQRQVAAAPPVKAMGDWSRVDRASIHEVNRDEVNRILDKISASGIGSLTPQERLFLSNFVPRDS